jgi:hypothetical protein
MKFLTTLLFFTMNILGAPENPSPQPVNFISNKLACTYLNGKITLAKAWPFGSWEDCAYSILGMAGQLNNEKAACERKLAAPVQAPPTTK